MPPKTRSLPIVHAHRRRSTNGRARRARARIRTAERTTWAVGTAGRGRGGLLLLWAGRARAPIDELARGRGWYLVFQRDTSRGDRVEGGGA